MLTLDRSTPPALVKRIILVVLDGLRPDAIARFELSTLAHLVRVGASTLTARTVQPSVTAAAMASLLTGAPPSRHGFQSDRIGIPRPTASLDPLPRVLRDHGFPTSTFMEAVPLIMRPIAHRLASNAGVQKAQFTGRNANGILAAAERTLKSQERGLVLLHFPDADRAGHANGWMSSQYAKAARTVDDALASVAARVDADDVSTMVVVVADHGGGGTRANEHDSEHELDCTIPIILAGGAIQRRDLGAGVKLLDVPATILWSLGIALPESYAGRPLKHAFRSHDTSLAAAALRALPPVRERVAIAL